MNPKQGLVHGAKRWASLAAMVPGALVSEEDRQHWVQAISVAAGLLVGTVEARKVFL